MIESIENTLQVVILLVCAGISLHKAAGERSRAWTLLSFFYGSEALADIYWLVCLIFYNHTPQIPVVSDLSWYASYIFLYMLLRYVAPPQSAREKRFLPWLGPIFAIGMAAFFMQWGQIMSNLIYASLMGLLLFSVIRRFLDRKGYAAQQLLCVTSLVFCLLEYAMWISSCLFDGKGLENPYYWFDILMTVCFVFFLPTLGKIGRSLPQSAADENRQEINEQQSEGSDHEAARQSGIEVAE